MKKFSILAYAFFSFGCTEKIPSNVILENKNTLIYNNNILNEECSSFFTASLPNYLVCNSWKTKAVDIDSMLKFSKKYQPNFIAIRHLMTPIEVDLYKIIERDNRLYILYPNGFFIVTEKDNYDYKNQYTEINQSYACLREECEKYFLWKFVDEAIIEKNPNFEVENPRSDDIAVNLLEKNKNAQPHFVFKTDQIDINGRICRFKKIPTDQVKDCLYYITNDTLYIYNESAIEGQGLVHQFQLKNILNIK